MSSIQRLAAVVVCLTAAVAAHAATDAASILPENTTFYATAPDVSAWREAAQDSSMQKLLDDPAMDPFIADAKGKISRIINEKIEELWGKLELSDAPTLNDLPAPTGQCTLAFRLDEPNDAFDSRPADMAYQLAIIVDFGANIDKYRTLYDRLMEKFLSDSGRRDRREVRGGTMDIFWKPRPVDGAGDDETTKLCFAHIDNTVLISNSEAYLAEILALRDGSERPSMADDDHHGEMVRTLDGPGHLFAYVNIQQIIDHALSQTTQMPSAQTARIIRALGFDNCTGAGLSMHIAPREPVQFQMKALLAVDGPKRGVPALLCPADMATTPPTSLGKGLASFMVANIDIGQVYDNLVAMVSQASGQQVGMFVQMMMMRTADQQAGGRPAVNLRQDVLGQIEAPLIVQTRVTAPHDLASVQTRGTFPVADPAVLDEALGRLHGAFIGRDELKREMRQTSIYLTPDGAAGATMAFAVAGDTLQIGNEDAVAQAIRDMGRDDVEPISADPMYRRASPFLPAHAGAWAYENYRITAEVQWTQFRNAARRADGNNDQPGEMMGRPAVTPMDLAVKQLKKFCNFSLLPEFDTVRKHFGVGVSFVKGTDQGVYFEAVGLKAPSQN